MVNNLRVSCIFCNSNLSTINIFLIYSVSLIHNSRIELLESEYTPTHTIRHRCKTWRGCKAGGHPKIFSRWIETIWLPKRLMPDPKRLHSFPTEQSTSFFLQVYLFWGSGEKEQAREHVHKWQGQKARERDLGLDLTTWSSRPEPRPRVGCSTDCATQLLALLFVSQVKHCPKCTFPFLKYQCGSFFF